MVWVRQFFCISLKTTTKITAWLDIICSFIAIWVYAGLLKNVAETVDTYLRPNAQPEDREVVTALVKGVCYWVIVINVLENVHKIE